MSQAFAIEVEVPDIDRWQAGNTGTDWVYRWTAAVPGPTVMVNALTHGNEVTGAIVLDALLSHGLRPRRGSLILSFANVAAYRRFDPAEPTLSRFVDEDFNRVWGRLDSMDQSCELVRARALRQFVESADLLLDLHSMRDPCDALMLAGPLDKGLALARALATPPRIVRDQGHAAGLRMRDYGAFGDPRASNVALLLEAGQHWQKRSEIVAKDVTARFLVHAGVCAAAELPQGWWQPAGETQKVVAVTHAITTRSGNFRFAMPVAGLDVVPRAGTVLGQDDERIVATPYDDCVLIMPAVRGAKPGSTVVRLGRYVD